MFDFYGALSQSMQSRGILRMDPMVTGQMLSNNMLGLTDPPALLTQRTQMGNTEQPVELNAQEHFMAQLPQPEGLMQTSQNRAGPVV